MHFYLELYEMYEYILVCCWFWTHPSPIQVHRCFIYIGIKCEWKSFFLCQQLDKTVSQSEIQNYTDYWFEKKDGGSAEQYSLQAVVNGRYLSITHKKSIKIPVFELEKDPGDCFFATEID